jgi:hypothetical protein
LKEHGGTLTEKRRRKKYVVVPGDGDTCPRCREPMQIRDYEKQPSESFSYKRWFCCMNESCKTTLVMPARYRVA